MRTNTVRSVVSLPLFKAYDERILHLAENNQLRASKIEDSKIIQSQATQLLQKRAEVFQLQYFSTRTQKNSNKKHLHRAEK